MRVGPTLLPLKKTSNVEIFPLAFQLICRDGKDIDPNFYAKLIFISKYKRAHFMQNIKDFGSVCSKKSHLALPFRNYDLSSLV